MKISLKWLNQFLSENISLDEKTVNDLAEKVERTSVEVDSVSTLAKKQDGLVVAKVCSIVAHPDSDHMVITQLDIGQKELVQVVTGAPNVAEGQLVILAKVGAHILDAATGKLVELKVANLRGQESFGMLVALQEIGFDNKIAPKDFEAGIFVFDEQDGMQVGEDALEVLGMNEPVIDTDLTPNRADMLSMIGTAYEFGAMLNLSVLLPEFDLAEYEKETKDQITLDIQDKDLTSKYAVRVINNVSVTDSPLWLQKILWNAGMRPINNIVDITNYMMLMYGQPLHAFDLDKLHSHKIIVRRAKNSETLTTLDGQKRDLRANEDIVVATDDEALMLAGVMGGVSSEVDSNTKNIVIESAIFNASLIRATARRHNIHSEASARFERGINRDNTFVALDHAAQLADEVAHGQISHGMVVAVDEPYETKKQKLSIRRVNKILGTALSEKEISDIFAKLNFQYTVSKDVFEVVLPARRPDLSIEADLIEEIARLYGYDNLPMTLPYGPTTPGKLTTTQRQIRASRRIMESLGMNQAISYVLTTPEKAKQFAENAIDEVVSLDYPMSSDRTTVRQNLLAGLLEDVSYNVSHSVHNIALYEQGRIFISNNKESLPTEIEHIAGVLTGTLQTSTWQTSKMAQPVDFYDIKGIVDSYLEQIGVANVTYRATTRHDNMHPGQTADVYSDNTYLGFVGQIHPKLTKSQKLPAIFGFELNLFTVLSATNHSTEYKVVSRFPQISRDVALLVNNQITHEDIIEVIQNYAGDKLFEVKLFDVYVGDKLPAGKKSLAYNLVFQDENTTLVESEINVAFNRVLQALVSEIKAEIR
ncbi:phenylalanine--tRNA ligase subunit beta [Leuconostoc palmae]|uniref:phenylalanine--tRNA ligase subunit beta n=1 Tax=Leuconostoc palmae TaxID=501487 RepID=UPI001C7D3A1A|nr:phenylalanine--tRNA ligase subunit beta [Leuconostoc palmae]